MNGRAIAVQWRLSNFLRSRSWTTSQLSPMSGLVSRSFSRSSMISPCRCGQLDMEASRSYISVVRAVGLKILKNKLSEYIRLAAGGETVLVTDRDRIVAEIVPPGHGRGEWLGDAVLADAVRNGWVTPPALPQQGTPPRSPVATLDVLLRELRDDRNR